MENSPSVSGWKNGRKLRLAFFCFLVLLVVIDRWILLDAFTFRYVDDDQSIMWYGAKEFGSGGFHEPYFFGQPYNTMLESLVAVPLIRAGWDYPVALTVVMSLFTLLPFVLFAISLFRKGKELQAFLVLSLPLLVPVEFGMLTAISRGAIVGVFLSSFGLLALFSSSRFRFFFFGLFGMIGFWANPNAAILLLPVGCWQWIEHFRRKEFYLQLLAGMIPGILLYYLCSRFYVLHPETIVHQSWPLDISPGRIRPAEWNTFFDDVIPVFWKLGWLLFPLLLFIGWLLLRQGKKAVAAGLFCSVVLLFFSLMINKVHDGIPSVFYSRGRMFLAVPFLIAVFSSQLEFRLGSVKQLALLLLVPFSFFLVKAFTVKSSVHHQLVEIKEHNMYVGRIDSLKMICRTMSDECRENHVSLVVVGNHPMKHMITYAFPCLDPEFPATLEPQLDRRTWVLDEQETAVHEAILFAGFPDVDFSKFEGAGGVTLFQSGSLPVVLLKGNSLQTGRLLDSLGIGMRAH